MHVILIAAITADGYIARHSNEIVSWSLDLHLFKKQTMGFPVIMGSNTKKTLNIDSVSYTHLTLPTNREV